MAQPDYVPITPADRVRPVERLPAPPPWWADRPADLRGANHPVGRRLGVPGPDQGYGLHLAERFRHRLALTPGESAEDAIIGCLGVALRRATLFDRAPVVFDCELAFTVWGFLGGAPEDLMGERRPLFQSAAHDYWSQRTIAAAVREEALRLTPAQVRERLGRWRELIDTRITARPPREAEPRPVSSVAGGAAELS
jgi:hypothetical protein